MPRLDVSCTRSCTDAKFVSKMDFIVDGVELTKFAQPEKILISSFGITHEMNKLAHNHVCVRLLPLSSLDR